MKAAVGLGIGLIVGAAVGWGVAYNYGTKVPGAGTSAAVSLSGADAGSADQQALFQLDDVVYSAADVPAEVKSALFETQYEGYERINSMLTQYAVRLSLAKEKNKDVKPDDLPEFEALLSAQKPSEDEMKQVFEANKSRLPPDMTFDQVKSEIEKFVTNQKLSEALRAKTQELESAGRFKVLLPQPTPPVVNLNLAAYPSKGAPNAEYVLVEASDYLCPHCQQLHSEVEAVLKEGGDKLRFVHVNYSLRPEGLSGQLARGAYCAKQQGDEAFWRYHESGYKVSKEKAYKITDPESPEALKAVATAAGIDADKLEECTKSPEAQNFVNQAVQEMKTAGVTGTPTFFMNGHKLILKDGLRGAVQSKLGAASH